MGRAWGLLPVAAMLAACADMEKPAPVTERGQAARAESRSRVPPEPGAYRVQAGDTLYSVAFARDLDYRELARLNALEDDNLIRVGQWLRLPAGGGVRTAPVAETPAAVRERPLGARVDTVRKPTPDDAGPAAPIWHWPAAGRVLAEFEPARGRKGLDIVGRRGSPVRAASAGKVVYAGSALRGYGKLTIVRHGTTLLTAYAHQSAQHVAEGQAVAAGQVIGAMGDSDAGSVKLHFEVREKGKPVDPRLYLPVRSEYGPG